MITLGAEHGRTLDDPRMIGLTAIRTLASLKRYVEKGGLASDLAQLDLEAAATALKKSEMAQDPASQMWSAINHLESAETKYLSLYTDKVFARAAWNNEVRNEYWSDLVKVRLLMAACYLYLGETRLCLSALDSVRDCVAIRKAARTQERLGMLAGVFTLGAGMRRKDWMSDFVESTTILPVNWGIEVEPVVQTMRALAAGGDESS